MGYKQELERHYSSLQIFSIAFSIMGLLPSIAATLPLSLPAGPVGMVWVRRRKYLTRMNISWLTILFCRFPGLVYCVWLHFCCWTCNSKCVRVLYASSYCEYPSSNRL